MKRLAGYALWNKLQLRLEVRRLRRELQQQRAVVHKTSHEQSMPLEPLALPQDLPKHP